MFTGCRPYRFARPPMVGLPCVVLKPGLDRHVWNVFDRFGRGDVVLFDVKLQG